MSRHAASDEVKTSPAAGPGAWTRSPRPAIVMVDGGPEELLRRAETFEDLVALDGAAGTGAQSRSRR